MDQMALFARCSLQHQIKMMEMIISPMLAASGVDYKPGKVLNKKPAKTREQKDADRLKKLSRIPVGVRTVQTSQNTPGKAKATE